MRRWLRQLGENYRLLLAAVQREGKRLESLSYASILKLDDGPADPTPVEGREVVCSAELVQVRPNGDALVCIDADGLPTWFRVKPSYVFYKRPDDSVHYGEA